MKRILKHMILGALCTLGTFLVATAETIENRDGRSLISGWWASDGAAPYAYTIDFANAQQVHTAPYALKVTYSKSNEAGNAYGFFAAKGLFNLRNFDYLSFWVYNNGAPLKFRVRLEDTLGRGWESNWGNMEPPMATTNADWENIVIDLTRTFSSHNATNIDMTQISQIMFMPDPGSSNTVGEFWIDDIEAQRAPGAAPLESFESDFFGWAAGGVFAIVTNTTEQFQNSGGPTNLGQKSLKLTWGSKAANYDNFTYTPTHDAAAPAGRIGNYTNFTLYGNDILECWVRSPSDNAFEILAKFTGATSSYDLVMYPQFYYGSGTWQKLTWYFPAGVSNVASTVQTVSFFPYPGLADNGGTMYIDNINLIRGPLPGTNTVFPPVPTAPTNFTSTATVPDGDGVYTVCWSTVSGAAGYKLHESTNGFTTYTTTLVTTNKKGYTKSVATSGVAYVYRVSSYIVSGTTTNCSSYTAPLSVTVKTIPNPLRKYEVIANFNGLNLASGWWGSDGVFPYVYTFDFASTQQVHSAPTSLRVDYRKTNDLGNTYAFYSAMGRFNLRNFDYLSFWVYNTGTPVRFRIRLEDTQGRPWESNWAGIEPAMKTATSDWENLVCDLTRTFGAHNATNIDMTQIAQIMFMVDPGVSNTMGTFWMDDVEVHRAANSAPVETFESDFYGWASGGPFAINTTSNDFRNDGTLTGLGQQSLKVSWTNKTADFSNVTYTPGHDTANAPTGRIGNYANLTINGNGFVELWVKSTTETSLPILMKLDSTDVSVQTYTGAGAWQRLTWDYSALGGAANAGGIYLYPYPNQADSGGSFCVDDMNFIGGSAQPVPYAPTNFTTTATVPDGDGVYTVCWSSVSGCLGYQLHESTNGFVTYTTTNLTTNKIGRAKTPTAAGVTFAYRVCTRIVEAGKTNCGTFTAPIMVSVKTIPTALRKYDILDNFSGQSLVATWWGSDGVFPYVYEFDFASTQKVHSAPTSLRVDYRKTNDLGNTYAFYSAMGRFNLRNFDYLSFWVYNTGTPARFRIRLEDTQGRPWESNWAGIEPAMKTATSDWENLVCDLTRTFGAHNATNIDMTQIAQIMFMVDPGVSNTMGTFWMDDVEVHRAANSAPVETFESDFYGWASGGPFAINTTSNDFRNDGTLTGLGQQSLKVSWTNKTADFSNVTYTPGHDTANAPTGRIGNYANLTINGNGFVELWVKSTTETSLPILMKLDSTDVSVQTYTGAGAWQRLTWDYSALGGAANAGGIYLYPYPNQADSGGSFCVDDMNFIGGSAQPVPYAPTGVACSATSPETDGAYSVSWTLCAGASKYEVQESTNSNFSTYNSYVTTNANIGFNKNTAMQHGMHYYRIRSCVTQSGVDTWGSMTKPLIVDILVTANRIQEMIEGFDGPASSEVSGWWTSDTAAPYAYGLDFANTAHAHAGNYALRVDYNKNNDANAYSWLAAEGSYNLRSFDFLSFWVWNNGQSLKFRIRLEDTTGGSWESHWAGIEPSTVTGAADWENLVVDLTRTFSASINMSNIKQIIFMVEPGNGTASGTFWIDSIAVHRAVNSAPLEVFEADSFGWLSGGPFWLAMVSNQFYNSGTLTGLGNHGLQIAWSNKPAGDYSSVYYSPTHDAATAPVGRIGNYSNFTLEGSSSVELWVKSTTESNMPVLLKLNNADVSYQTYTGNGAWQRMVWKFAGMSDAAGVNLLHILPHPGAADSGGVIFIDDLNLIGGTTPAIPLAPTNFVASKPSHGVYTVSWAAVPGANNYQLEKSTNPTFATSSSFYPSGTSVGQNDNPGLYYYRVRTNVKNGPNDNYGSYTKAISLLVLPNARPVVFGQTLTVPKNVSTALKLNGDDGDEDALTFTVLANPTNGTLTGTSPNLSYKPNTNFAGRDSFSYKANDGLEDSVNSATIVLNVSSNSPQLSVAYQQQLNRYASATVRYFTSTQVNNNISGFTHAFYGTGRFQVYDNGIWREEAWDLTRGYGAHVNINECTLRMLSLAAAYKMQWLDYLPATNRYQKSWGTVLKLLQTLRTMQTNGNPMQCVSGTFHRTYLTTTNTVSASDLDRTVAETVRNTEDEQSSDDNALPYVNLLMVQGLANDTNVTIADRVAITSLCHQIRAGINLSRFLVNNQIAMNYTNGSPNQMIWDRESAEGPIILASMLLAGQISTSQFYAAVPSLQNLPVNWHTVPTGTTIYIDKPSYHSAMFIHGLRTMHGMPVTPPEFTTSLNFFVTSVKPITEAHIDYANYYGLKALGSQVMTQPQFGTALFVRNGVQVQFPGNENDLMPNPTTDLARATGPHAWFVPLARWRYLAQPDIDDIMNWAGQYETNFFHTGPDIDTQLGWEAAIPYSGPSETNYAWKASDGTWKYTDWGRPYEALNTGYSVLTLFDALNPDKPVGNYSVEALRMGCIAEYFDSGKPLPPALFP